MALKVDYRFLPLLKFILEAVFETVFLFDTV
jgi:hypothetical protein